MKAANLVLTAGDPAGLGPELICRLLGSTGAVPKADARLLIICPDTVLRDACRRFGLETFWTVLDLPAALRGQPPGVYAFTPPELEGYEPNPGFPEIRGGRAAALCLLRAVDLLLNEKAEGLVTGPLNKAMLRRAGYRFGGHTELLAVHSGLDPGEVCMHLDGPRLKVSLASTHIPLREVPDQLNTERIASCLALTWAHLQRLGEAAEPVAVCGLNPHAGEEGELGQEEIEVIAPAVQLAAAKGVSAVGPLPADTVFFRALQGHFSAVLAMYHDQGLAPLKLLHFGEAVNVTLGLPFVRTSVDHGTGYELVGSGQAGLSSLRRAIELAWRLV